MQIRKTYACAFFIAFRAAFATGVSPGVFEVQASPSRSLVDD